MPGRQMFGQLKTLGGSGLLLQVAPGVRHIGIHILPTDLMMLKTSPRQTILKHGINTTDFGLVMMAMMVMMATMTVAIAVSVRLLIAVSTAVSVVVILPRRDNGCGHERL